MYQQLRSFWVERSRKHRSTQREIFNQLIHGYQLTLFTILIKRLEIHFSYKGQQFTTKIIAHGFTE